MPKNEIVLNLEYMPRGHTGHLVPSQAVVDAFKKFYEKKPFTNLLEFGFCSGWSSAMILTLFPEVKITSIEMVEIDSSIEGVSILAEKFPGRHKVIWAKSEDVFEQYKKDTSVLDSDFDCCFIDGGHHPEIVDNDVRLCKLLGIKNYIFDDTHSTNITDGIKSHKELQFISREQYQEIARKDNGYKVRDTIRSLDHWQI